jgi:hypothetical protein
MDYERFRQTPASNNQPHRYSRAAPITAPIEPLPAAADDNDKVTISISFKIPEPRLPAMVRRHPKVWLGAAIVLLIVFTVGARHFWQVKHQLPVAYYGSKELTA